MKPLLDILCLFLTFSLFTSHICAEPAAVLATDEVIVRFAPEARNGAEVVVERFARFNRGVEERVGLRLREKPTIVLMNQSRAFHEYVGSDLVVAVAQPRNNRIIIDYAQVTRRPFSLDSILKHELCHLILHQNISGNSLPKWLDEGVAQWVSDGIAELVLTGGRERFDRAVVAGTTIPLQRLNNHFPSDREHLLLAYEQSKSFVAYLISEYGEDRLQELLYRLHEGLSINEAVQEIYRRPLSKLESNWLEDLKRKGVWFTFLTGYMYEFIFVAGALVTCIGFIRFLKKRRAYREMEGDDW